MDKKTALTCAYNLIGEELHEIEESWDFDPNDPYYMELIKAMATISRMLNELA